MATASSTTTSGMADLNDEQKKLAQHIRENGIRGLDIHLTSRLQTWRSIPLNVAVTGNSGSGKSTLINTLRGLKASDPGAAKVGCTETTAKISSYAHPDNASFLCWDLPGVGTPSHPRTTYMNTMDFRQFDFVLIVSGKRFTENDQWLAKELGKLNIPFFFIRSQLDTDLANARRDMGNEFSKNRTIDEIRNDCRKNLSPNFPDSNIYIISGVLVYASSYEDYNRLTVDIAKKLTTDTKREGFLYTMKANCQELIEMKVEQLKKKIDLDFPAQSTMEGIGAYITPVPYRLITFTKVTGFYREQLGLTEDAKNRLLAEWNPATDGPVDCVELPFRTVFEYSVLYTETARHPTDSWKNALLLMLDVFTVQALLVSELEHRVLQRKVTEMLNKQ